VHEWLLALRLTRRVDQLTAQPERDPRAIERAKQQVRNRIWALLEREGAAKPPGRVVGKIPNFLGAEAAAGQLAALPAWEQAHVLKANPDKAQRAVRARALTEGLLTSANVDDQCVLSGSLGSQNRWHELYSGQERFTC
jgi:hypothetical protein